MTPVTENDQKPGPKSTSTSTIAVGNRRMLSTIDTLLVSASAIFGSLGLALYLSGRMGRVEVLSLFMFFAANLVISIFSRRSSSLEVRYRIEFWRFWIIGPSLSALALVLIQGILAPYWFGFLLYGLGYAPVLHRFGIGQLSRGTAYAAWLMAVMAIAYRARGSLSSLDEVLNFSLDAAIVAMAVEVTSVIMGRLTELLREQSRKALELVQIKTIARLGMFKYSPSTGELECSRNSRNLLNLDPTAALTLESLLALIHPEDRPHVAETFCTNLREKLDTETEYQTLGPAGEIRWRRAIHRVLLNSQGGVDKVAGIVQDVTERKRAELLIEEQRARAITAPKLSSLGEMSSGIAHEINNPVAIIHGKARSLRIRALEGSLTPAEVVTFSEKIEATAMRIAKIVQSLRIFARDGRSDPFEPASLKKIVFDTLELCLERFKQNGIEVRIPPIDETLQIEVREVQIGQVLLNLLNNSFDAIESLPERWTELRVEELGESVRIRLTDSGAGIPASAREKIFNPSSPPKSWAKGLAWA